MDDLDYIKSFSKISVKRACSKSKANRGNVLSGRASKKTISKVRKQIESDIARLYLIGEDDEKRESSL